MNVEPDSLSAAIAAFLSEKAVELSPYSVAHLRASLTPMARALGDPPVASVDYAALRSYVDGLRLRYKPGTLRPTVGDIRQFWRWSKKRGIVDRNPAKRLKPPSRRAVVETAAVKAVSDDDARRVLSYLAGRLATLVYRDLFGNLIAAPPSEWSDDARRLARDLFILAFLYDTGCRAGELWRLSAAAMADATAAPGPVYRVASAGKTGEVVLRFTIATAELWSVWDSVRPSGDGHAVVGWGRGRPVGPLSTSTLSRLIARHCDRAGVARFRAHALRHAKVRRAKAAAGLEVASRLIGHGSTLVTAAYGRGDDEDLTAAALATGLTSRLWG
jgi:integrase